MKNSSYLRNILITLLILINIAADQISKKIVRENIEYNEKITLVKNFFTMTRIENDGAFLSLGDSLSTPFKKIFLLILPLLGLGYGLWFLFSKRNIPKRTTVALSFIIGGGIGNLIDRLLYESVTDFLHMDFILFETGIFNIADVSIMIGTALIFLSIFNKK